MTRIDQTTELQNQLLKNIEQKPGKNFVPSLAGVVFLHIDHVQN